MMRLNLKYLTLISTAIFTPVIFSADPLEPYLSKTTYFVETTILSSDCAYVDSNVSGFAPAVAIDFKLDGGALAISGIQTMNRRPLVGCEDSLEISLDSNGKLKSAFFSTSSLLIEGNDATIYNLTTSFNEARKPVAETGKYLFDVIDYSIAPTKACSDITENASLVSPQVYYSKVRAMMGEAENDSTTQYVDNPSDSPTEKTTSGPVSHWFYKSALDYAGTAHLQQFDSFIPEGADVAITWAAYQKYVDAICNVYLNQDSKAALFIEASVFVSEGLGWSAHASKWSEFEYLDTGRKVILSPSPSGLEHYTKYTAGAGIIIVAGEKVDDGALLAARDAFIYMTSARPEMRGILQRNHARVSLFTENASQLPEYGAEQTSEVGGFAQGRLDANMTANATWLCYPGNLSVGGNPAIHELGHTINHLVFEETNETYWYDRIIPLANAARENGTMPVGSPLGEYWAQAVEGYIMDKGEEFKGLFPTRANISMNHPELYDLLTRYLPTEKWDYCPSFDG
jgi:hypothetical protein|tara:strand:+ start:4465 stop:6006 length:1542 start_codon:yes stop_codon:yes gene_type:complete